MAIVKSLTAQEKTELTRLLKSEPWRPFPGPQVEAKHSEADEVFFGGSAGGGKALELSTPLPTPTGWTTMGDVAVGDTLFDEKGQPCRVTAVSDVMHDHDCYAVVFSDDSVLVADAGHQWLTLSYDERTKAARRTEAFRAARRARRPSRANGTRPHVAVMNRERQYECLPPPTGAVRTTAEIRDTLTVRRGKATNHCVPVAAPLDLPSVLLPLAPYVLGLWLGDGHTAGGGFTTADEFIVEAIRAAGFTITKNTWGDYGYYVRGLGAKLRRLGVLGHKHVPPAYLRGSEHQRLSLLQGLMDTDGGVDGRGQCEFTTTKAALRDGMLELLSSLGIKATIRQGLAKLHGRVIGLKWRVKFLTDLQVFRLPRKRDGQKRRDFRGTHAQRYVVAVLPVPSVPVKCVAVDTPSRLFLAGRTMIPTHNSRTLLGLAITSHRHSVIFRREYGQLRELVEQSREMLDGLGTFNGQSMTWRLNDGRTLEFGAVQHEKDRAKWQGRPHDFIGYDEVPSFTRSQYRFLLGWNRSSYPGQRCRVVATGNPPMRPEERWVVDEWGPWLDPKHPDPARPGELRWYTAIGDQLRWFRTGEPFTLDGETIKPRSRTFIPAKLEDNPVLADTGYRSVLQSLPEPLRSQLLYGDFGIGLQDDPYQIIPTAWIQESMRRWRANRLKTTGRPITMVGVDPARGGADRSAVARRYGRWVDAVKAVPGSQTPDGPALAQLVQGEILGQDGRPVINVDVIGVGSSAYDCLKLLRVPNVQAVNFAAGTHRSDRAGVLTFANTRAWAYWSLREQLEPDPQRNPEPLMLPDDPALLAELAAPRWRLTSSGVLVESKEDVIKRVGQSPDLADAVVLACFAVEPGTPLAVGTGAPSPAPGAGVPLKPPPPAIGARVTRGTGRGGLLLPPGREHRPQ